MLSLRQLVAGLTYVPHLIHCRGSAVDAMAEAIDNAEVLLFGVSRAYKE